MGARIGFTPAGTTFAVPGAYRAMGHSTRRVVRELRNKILRGELAPGAALRQEDLARQLGVSRVPLREALLVLTGDGLLVHRPNQGFGVAERSRSELSQVYLMLSLPEEELTRTLEWPPDAELLGELRHLNGQMAALVDDVDWLDMVPLNHAFHHAIWQLSPLKLVIGEVDRVWALADAYIASGYSSRSARAHTVEEHDRIIAALASRGRAELTAALVADAGPDRQDEPPGDEPRQGADSQDHGGMHSDDDIEDQQQRGAHGGEQEQQAEQREPVRDTDELALEPLAVDHPVERGGRDQQRGCAGSQDHGRDVGVALEVRDRGEPRGERQGEQERQQDLHTGLGDPDLLQDLVVGTVEPLQRGLAARAGELAEMPLLDLLAAEGGRRGILTTWYQISLS